MLTKTNKEISLKPAMFPFGCSSDLQLTPGRYHCRIHAKAGNILFRHTSYDIFTGCWDEKPSQDSDDCISIHEGEVRDLDFTCEDHYGHSDCLYFYNDSYLKPAAFTCYCSLRSQ